MTYSSEEVAEINIVLEQWLRREDDLSTSLLLHSFRTEDGREFTKDGVVRRLRLTGHAIRRVFEVIPLQAEEAGADARYDATLFLHAFLINIYGALDNMGKVWCSEADVRTATGQPIPKKHIGLGPKNQSVRETLSSDFQASLKGADGWFEYLEDYRHALAHRIPFYIPPRTLSEEEGEEWKRFEAEIAASSIANDSARWEELSAKQSQLGTFKPVIMHSYSESARPVLFHGQLIADFATVVDLGEKMMVELGALQKGGETLASSTG